MNNFIKKIHSKHPITAMALFVSAIILTLILCTSAMIFLYMACLKHLGPVITLIIVLSLVVLQMYFKKRKIYGKKSFNR